MSATAGALGAQTIPVDFHVTQPLLSYTGRMDSTAPVGIRTQVKCHGTGTFWDTGVTFTLKDANVDGVQSATRRAHLPANTTAFTVTTQVKANADSGWTNLAPRRFDPIQPGQRYEGRLVESITANVFQKSDGGVDVEYSRQVPRGRQERLVDLKDAAWDGTGDCLTATLSGLSAIPGALRRGASTAYGALPSRPAFLGGPKVDGQKKD